MKQLLTDIGRFGRNVDNKERIMASDESGQVSLLGSSRTHIQADGDRSGIRADSSEESSICWELLNINANPFFTGEF